MMEPPPNIAVKCVKCGQVFMTGPTEIDRIVRCPKGHQTFVRAGQQDIRKPSDGSDDEPA